MPLRGGTFAWIWIAAWTAAVGAGFWTLNSYNGAPGRPALAPHRWPAASRIIPVPGRATLVMLAHPNCPCTRASLGELAILMAQAPGRVSAFVLFGAPNDSAAEWRETDLWKTAAAIPDVVAIEDLDGEEARRFRAATSGQTLLYDTAGHLRFSGGITEARGHAGDNLGRTAIVSLLRTGASGQSGSAVYGCALVGALQPTERETTWRQ